MYKILKGFHLKIAVGVQISTFQFVKFVNLITMEYRWVCHYVDFSYRCFVMASLYKPVGRKGFFYRLNPYLKKKPLTYACTLYQRKIRIENQSCENDEGMYGFDTPSKNTSNIRTPNYSSIDLMTQDKKKILWKYALDLMDLGYTGWIPRSPFFHTHRSIRLARFFFLQNAICRPCSELYPASFQNYIRSIRKRIYPVGTRGFKMRICPPYHHALNKRQTEMGRFLWIT